MVVVLDFGSTLNKALVYENSQFHFYKFNVSYTSQVFSVKSISESFERLEKLSGLELLGPRQKPLGEFYLTTGLLLPSEIPDSGFIKASFSNGESLSAWEVPVLEVGFQFVSFLGRIGVGTFSPEELLKWLPFKASLTEVENYLYNRKLYSGLLPIFPRDLYLEKAIAREKIKNFCPNPDGPARHNLTDLTLSGGIFCACPSKAQGLQLLLDSFAEVLAPPTGIFLDERGSLPCLAVLKKVAPALEAQVPENLWPTFLGDVLCFDQGVELGINLGLIQELKVKVAAGTLFALPLKEGEAADLRVTFERGRSQNFKVRGGSVGFAIDCRKRPLAFPVDSGRRATLLKDWESQIGAIGSLTSL